MRHYLQIYTNSLNTAYHTRWPLGIQMKHLQQQGHKRNPQGFIF